jgi:hypothetical protein
MTEGTKGAFSMGDLKSVRPAGRTPLEETSVVGRRKRDAARNVAERIYSDQGLIAIA